MLTGTVPVGVIQGTAEAVGRPDLIMAIIAGVGQVDSAEPSYAMWALSRLKPGRGAPGNRIAGRWWR